VNEETKKKVLLGVLAVLALGFGGYYFFLSGSGDEAKGTKKEVAARKERDKPRDVRDNTRKERAERTEEVTQDEAPERLAREEEDESAPERKSRRREGEKVKKKEMKPAA